MVTAQEVQLPGFLHALGNHLEFQTVADGNNAWGDFAIAAVVGVAAGSGTIYFQFVDRQRLEIAILEPANAAVT